LEHSISCGPYLPIVLLPSRQIRLGFGVQGLEIWVLGLGFGFWVLGLGFRIQGLGSRVLGSGFRIEG
jgi:hypothetical protein